MSEVKKNKVLEGITKLGEKFQAWADKHSVKLNEDNTETNFAEVTLADGSMLSYEGDLAEGTAMFTVDEESGENIPAAEGTYELGGDMEGTSITLDAEGIVIEMTTADEQNEDEESEEQMSKDDIKALVAKEISSLVAPLTDLVESLKPVVESNEDFKAQLEKINEEFTAFKDSPSQKDDKKPAAKPELTAFQKAILDKKRNK